MSYPQDPSLNVIESAYYLHENSGYLRIYQQDAVSFLNRQTTNKLTEIHANQILHTVLTSPNARILDVLGVFLNCSSQNSLANGEDTLNVLTLPGRGKQTLEFLSKRIFFMDVVSIEDLSSQFYQIELIGSGSAKIISQLGLDRLPEPSEMVPFPFQGSDLVVFGIEPAFNLGYKILLPRQIHDPLQKILEKWDVIALNRSGYEVIRVEKGRPGPSGELNERFTPLETGLGNLISGDKGCYTGQEVIARQISYDKVTQVLAGVRLEKEVRQGARVQKDKRSIGTITSVAFSERFGWIALAIIKRSYLDYGSQVDILDFDDNSGEDALARGSISSLPFS